MPTFTVTRKYCVIISYKMHFTKPNNNIWKCTAFCNGVLAKWAVYKGITGTIAATVSMALLLFRF
jgi:hypothetical protein